MTTEHKCPHCGKAVPTTALGGICPECMLKVGLTETGEVGAGGTVVVNASAPPPIAQIAPHFPQLEIIECLGRGGMGVVYKARQPRLDRFVALKILSRKHESGITDAEFEERFQREARALARLNHPDIVAVYDFGEAGGYHYLLMEYVDGVTLRSLLQTRKLTPEQALVVVPKICEALQFAHEHGIVHRDIKPENILLDKSGRVKIADFGIAKMVATAADQSALTGAKDVLGTPHYMAPEQVEKPALVDHRADIFSLGVVFYEMLTGELPLGKFAPPSRKVQVDVRLDEVVLHALEKEPERRYQHASEVKTDVERIAATAESSGHNRESSALARDAVWFSLNPLADLLPGERVIHFEKRVWWLMFKSLPTYRWFFSLPPLCSAGLYVTNRRVLLISHFLGLAQRLSLWFSGKAPDEEREFLRTVTIGSGGMLGGYLQLESLDYKDRWYRGRQLLLRLYLSNAEEVREEIRAAQAGAESLPAPGSAARHDASARPGIYLESPSGGVLVMRWAARILSLFMLGFFGFFVFGEGLPPIASQPEGVQLSFAAITMLLLGLILGWRREGTGAWLIGLGWTTWHISEGRINITPFDAPLVVALLYAACWWTTQGRRTGAILGTVFTMAALLFCGRLLVPTSVFVRGAVLDATTLQPVANVEMRLLPRPPSALEKGDPPNTRTDQYGRFTLYVGWYAKQKQVVLSATNYVAVTTNLGARNLGQHNVSRDFQLAPVESTTAAFDPVRAVALFNDIEDFGDEFDAAFTAKNLAAAQTGTRLLLDLLTNFNATVKGSGLEFPLGIFDDIAKIRGALQEGNWDEARRLAQHNEDYARAFRRISERMVELAREQRQKSRPTSSPASPKDVPPVVIDTNPQSGASDVDPNLEEIRATFSKPMLEGGWAWCKWGEENFPAVIGDSRYLPDGCTCVLPVKLQPGRVYALWLNSEYHYDFRDRQGHPALPYLLIFETKK